MVKHPIYLTPEARTGNLDHIMFKPPPHISRRLALFGLMLVAQSSYLIINKNQTGGVAVQVGLDRAIPLWPEWVVIYILALLIWISLTLWAAWRMEERQYLAFITAMLAAIIPAVLIFLFYPTYVIRPELTGSGWGMEALRYIYANDRTYNAFPSGHIYLTAIPLYFYARWKPKFWVLCVFTMILITLSTLFTKQHSVLDLIGGFVWAAGGIAFGWWWAFNRNIKPS
jgi:membrane-associated phospholipid phosphatase